MKPLADLEGVYLARAHPPMARNFLNFMQFFGKFGNFVCWDPTLDGWGPLPMGNPGSTPGNDISDMIEKGTKLISDRIRQDVLFGTVTLYHYTGLRSACHSKYTTLRKGCIP